MIIETVSAFFGGALGSGLVTFVLLRRDPAPSSRSLKDDPRYALARNMFTHAEVIFDEAAAMTARGISLDAPRVMRADAEKLIKRGTELLDEIKRDQANTACDTPIAPSSPYPVQGYGI